MKTQNMSETNRWELYVNWLLSSAGELTQQQKEMIVTFLEQSKINFALPQVDRYENDSIRFSWNTKNLFLDLEFYLDGSIEWFFKDRRFVNKLDGEDCQSEISGKVYEYLTLVKDELNATNKL